MNTPCTIKMIKCPISNIIQRSLHIKTIIKILAYDHSNKLKHTSKTTTITNTEIIYYYLA